MQLAAQSCRYGADLSAAIRVHLLSQLLFRLFHLLLSFLAVSSELEFVVEEPEAFPGSSRSAHRIHHRIRHSRGFVSTPASGSHTTVSPSLLQQKPASSTPLTSSFSLNCPHVADSSNKDVRLEVTWTLDDAVWLKIADGEKRIVNRLTSFNKRAISGKTVLRVTLNDGRYWFDYDELTGDFAMEISPVISEEDAGVWQCHVTVHFASKTHTLTSRSRVKGTPRNNSTKQHFSSTLIDRRQYSREHKPVQLPLPKGEGRLEVANDKVSSFSRPDQHVVQISRDSDRRRQTVVFDRDRHHVTAAAAVPAVDYEISMADSFAISDRESDDVHFEAPVHSASRTRPRSASSIWNSASSRTINFCSILTLCYCILELRSAL